jgi:hypothetical protein
MVALVVAVVEAEQVALQEAQELQDKVIMVDIQLLVEVEEAVEAVVQVQ